MKIADFDNHVLIASQPEFNYNLYIVKWCAMWRYCIEEEGNAFTVGEQYENKTQFVSNAYQYAIEQGFKDNEILNKYPRNITVTLNESQRIAINTAISILGRSNSDHAEQAYCHLKSIVSQF